jgi:glycine oxidase
MEEAGYNKEVTAAGMSGLLQAAQEIAPGLASSPIREAWSGLRPGTPDGLPILGKSPIGNFIVAAGHFRNGILLAPITARLITELVLSGRTSIPLRPFRPERFGEEASGAG